MKKLQELKNGKIEKKTSKFMFFVKNLIEKTTFLK